MLYYYYYYIIVVRWNPMKQIAEDICGWWLGLCLYTDYRILT